MSARRLTLLLLGLAVIVVMAMLAIALVDQQRQAGAEARILTAEDRADAIAELQSATNAYGREVVAVLLLGRPRLDQLGTARIAVEYGLSHLTNATKAEFATLAGATQVQDQLPDVDADRHLTEIYHSIDGATNQALAQQRANNMTDALQLYNGTISFRLGNEFQPILDAEAQKEATELATLRSDAASSGSAMLWTEIAVAIAGILFLAGSGLLLWRRLDAELGAEARKLEGANARLHSSDEQRAHFLADISHQLRTPLTILRGEADVALRGDPPASEMRAALQRVQTQAAEMANLLEDLMAYARSDAENSTHEPVDVRLDDVVGAPLVEGQTLAEPREITIAADFQDFGTRLHADPRRLRQAVLIGLDNAIKHTPPGGRIEVATARGDNGVSIRILDSGPGIDPEEQPRLFDRFYRGKGEKELLNDGNGIGLAIARDIVGRHGGSIDLNNRKEGGAVLEIALPTGSAP